MKKRKVCAGTIALAIAVSSVIPLGNYNINSSAYAAEIDDQKESNDDLNSLLNEKASVKDSISYKNANKAEKEAYDSAIANAENSSDADSKDEDVLVENIKNAKKNLAGNSYQTYENRQALSSTIAMANKLKASLENKDISDEDKSKLSSTLEKSINILNDNEVNSDDIDQQNKTLAGIINELEEKYELDGSSALTSDDIEAIKDTDSVAYGKARSDLGNLVNTVKEFTESKNYSKISNKEIVDTLYNSSIESKNVYDNPNSTTEDLVASYKNLNTAYNEALSNIGKDNTEVNRLKEQIKTYSTNPKNYDKASKSAQQTYDIAKKKAQDLLADSKSSTEQLSKALNNLKRASLSLAPVPVKTLDDDNDSTKTYTIDDLKNLVNEANSYREKAIYKNSSDDVKKDYDDSIKDAEKIINSAKYSEADLKEVINKINNSKSAIESPNKDDDSEDIDKAISELKELKNKSEEVKKDLLYKNASDKIKENYDQAINEAIDLLSKYANKKKVSADDAFKSIENINKALKDLGFDVDISEENDKSHLEDLISNAEFAINHKSFSKFAQVKRDRLKDAYDEAKKASTDDEIKSAISDLEAALKPFKELINDNDNDEDEKLDLNDLSLEELLALSNKVIEYKDYKNDVGLTQSKNLLNAIKAVKSSKSDQDKEDSKKALISALNQSEIKPIVDQILNKDNSDDEETDENLSESINKIIDEDQDFRKTDKYSKAQNKLKQRYEKTISDAMEAIKDKKSSQKDLKKLLEDLKDAKEALDGDEFATKLKEIKDKFAAKGDNIADSKIRSDLEKKIKDLSENKDSTMDDLLAVESELNKAIPKGGVSGSNTPASSTTTTETKTVPKATTKTTPVTTTKKVPATVNPGSIVRTGIKSLVGVVVVLAVAVGAFVVTGNNKDKNEGMKKERKDENK